MTVSEKEEERREEKEKVKEIEKINAKKHRIQYN